MTSLPFKFARRLLRPLLPAYYRWFYGRSFAGAAGLDRQVRSFEQRAGRGDVPLSRRVWDEQYGRGEWDFLERSDELARYALIAGYVAKLAPGGRVLDVGSGDGLLLDHLAPHGYEHYTGVDLSEVAVERGRTRQRPATRFEAADAESWQPDGSFDVVVFNECLYYFEQPEATTLAYLGHLAPGGVAIVSMFRSPRTDAIARRLARLVPPAEEVELRHRKGAWRITVLRPDAARVREDRP